MRGVSSEGNDVSHTLIIPRRHRQVTRTNWDYVLDTACVSREKQIVSE